MADKSDGAIRIDTTIDLDGLKKGIQQMQDSVENGVRKIRNAMEKVDRTAEDTANAIEDVGEALETKPAGMEQIEKQLENINRQIEVQQRLMDGLKSQYERVADASGADSTDALKLEKQMLSAQQAIDKLIGKSDRLAQNLREMDRNAGRTASGGMGRLGDETKKAGQNTEVFGEIAKSVFRAFGIDADNAIDGAISALDAYKDSLDGTAGHTGAVSGALAGAFTGMVVPAIGAVINKVLEMVSAIVTAAMEIEDAGARMSVALGLTEEEAQSAEKSIENLNSSGIFEDGEAEQAITMVIRLFEKTGAEAEDLALRMQAISKATRTDLESIAYAASSVTRAFEDEGITAVQSIDLVAGALRTGKVEASDLLDAMREFGPTYEHFGYTAEEMVLSLTQGVEAGAESADLAGSALQTFYDNIIQGSADTQDALRDLGLSTESVTQHILEGGPRAAHEYERIAEKVAQLEGTTKGAQIAAELFGEEFLKSSPKIIEATAQTGGALEGMVGASTEAVVTMISTTSAQWNGLWKDLVTGTGDFFSSVSDVFFGGSERIEQAQEKLNRNLLDQINAGGKEAAAAQLEAAQIRYDAALQEYERLNQAFIQAEEGITVEQVWQAEKRLAEAEKNLEKYGGAIPESMARGVKKTGNVLLDAVGSLIDRVQSALKGFLSGGGLESLFSSGSGYAQGTLSASPGPRLINERGPEAVMGNGVLSVYGGGLPALVNFRGGERVYNATQTLALSAAEGRGRAAYTANTYYVTIDAKDVKEFNDVVRIAQNKAQSAWKGWTGE